MAKWIWRFLSENNLLWVKVIKSCYGNLEWDGEGLWAEGNRNIKSVWWRRVVGLSRGDEGKWVSENLERVIGEGNSVRFWRHKWVGKNRLADDFPRLYRLNNNKEGYISNMGEWREGTWEWKLEWERNLRERDFDQSRILSSCISNVRLNAGTSDSWRWKGATNGDFSVKTAYESFIRKRRMPNQCEVQKELALIWKAKVPAKAIATAWKVLKGRISTVDNLRRRQAAMQVGSDVCALCQEKDESIEHLFFLCQKADEIWKEILRWIGKQVVFHHKTKAHFNAFVNIGNKKNRGFFLGVWICVIWSIWKNRNNCIFNQGSWIKDRMMAEIKTRIWGWRLTSDQTTQEHEFRSWFLAAKGVD